MEAYLTTSIEPIEVAYVRAGLGTALDVAAVKAVERGAVALEGGGLRRADSTPADDEISAALIAALGATPVPWKTARAKATPRARDAAHALEHRLVAAGLLHETTPWRWITGRRTQRGKIWLAAAQLAYPAAQIVATDPALALALHGPRALDGTRYHAATVAAASTSASDGAGCGASFAGDGGHGGHGDGGSGGCSSGGCSGGGCGGGGCGGGG